MIVVYFGYPASFTVGDNGNIIFWVTNEAAVDDTDDVVERNGRFGQSRREDHFPFANSCDCKHLLVIASE